MFVIGINGFRLRKWSESDPPYIVKSVLGIGNYFSIISLKRLEAINDGYEDRQYIIKENKSCVSTSSFRDGKLSGISGFIYSNADFWNLPASLGSDFKFVHNPTATPDIKIQQGWMPIGQEYWMEEDKLRDKQYSG